MSLMYIIDALGQNIKKETKGLKSCEKKRKIKKGQNENTAIFRIFVMLVCKNMNNVAT